MAWKVLFFQTARGDFPVEDFIQEQEKATYAKILQFIQLLVNNGPFLKPPYIKKLQGKLYELRISAKVEIRIFYTITNNTYYLLHAFKKKGQKTPAKELNIALARIKEIV